NADAAIALFFGVMEVALPSVRVVHVCGHVVGLGLELLHADEIRVLPGEPFEKALAGGGADAVEVGRDDAYHASVICLEVTGTWILAAISSNLPATRACCVLAPSLPRPGASRRIFSMPGCSTTVSPSVNCAVSMPVRSAPPAWPVTCCLARRTRAFRWLPAWRFVSRRRASMCRL